MKLIKIKQKLKSAKMIIANLLLTTTLSGCAKTGVSIVKSDTFCEGKFNTQYLLESDYDNIDQIKAKNPLWKSTIDKLTDNKTLNEKEFDQCK